MTRKKMAMAALATWVAAGAALAHSGATGVVRERMEGMVAMRDAMRDVTPMMRGEAPYDAARVAEAGRAIAAHAGSEMTRLFPEGSADGVSYAKEAIWQEPETFDALAEELRRHAEGLVKAAPNGLTAPDPHAGMAMGGSMAGHEGMTMPDQSSDRAGPGAGYSVAQLLGIEPRRSAEQEVSGATATKAAGSSAPGYATLAAPDVFRRIGETCAACHGRYRAGS
ncbi:cytochrome c556 [Limimaricola soesokkakensis]|uniref:Cytochrome C n=1 Tax=Limimaricola soesokkakensis TaxID=1343159 RepID=A0A1X7A436_9RHOB|nr:cytochrome c [Limimaricola soesokkakensis]PSK80816.1 cytochrome c556 [Limimaricola soesokkakensis]SLN69466.1 Cytochrome C' [Limimaricola soesokkakensis]